MALRWAVTLGFVLYLLESPPVFGSVPLKGAGAPVHAYDMFGAVLAKSCMLWVKFNYLILPQE
jgi:hypothetical protein